MPTSSALNDLNLKILTLSDFLGDFRLQKSELRRTGWRLDYLLTETAIGSRASHDYRLRFIVCSYHVSQNAHQKLHQNFRTHFGNHRHELW